MQENAAGKPKHVLPVCINFRIGHLLPLLCSCHEALLGGESHTNWHIHARVYVPTQRYIDFCVADDSRSELPLLEYPVKRKKSKKMQMRPEGTKWTHLLSIQHIFVLSVPHVTRWLLHLLTLQAWHDFWVLCRIGGLVSSFPHLV